MKLILFALGVLILIAGIGTPAKAQNYPWCAHLDFGGDESVNCAFVSFDQCMATVRGIGGFCMANNTYQAPVLHPSHQAHKHYSHQHS
jgi:hypothetical protein